MNTQLSRPSFLEFLFEIIYKRDYDFEIIKDFDFNDWDMSRREVDGWSVNPLDYCVFHGLQLKDSQWDYLIELFCSTHEHEHESLCDGNTFLTLINQNSFYHNKFTAEQYLKVMSACSMAREDILNGNCLYYLLKQSNEPEFHLLRPCLDKALKYFFHKDNLINRVETEHIDLSKPLCSTYDNICLLFQPQFSAILPYALSQIPDIDWFINYAENYYDENNDIKENAAFIALKEQRVLLQTVMPKSDKQKLIKL